MFGANGRDGSGSAERAIRPLEPARNQLGVSQALLCQRQNAGEAIEPIRLVTGEATCTSPALQTAWREVEAVSQFFQRQSRRAHQLRHDPRTEAFADSFIQIMVIGEGPAHRSRSTQLFKYGSQLVDHLSLMIATIVADVNLETLRKTGAHGMV